MASSALQADGEPRIIGDIIALDADMIDASDRLRPIDPEWADALGQVMRAKGQRTPIEVCRQEGAKAWRLVSGGHRHAAATLYPDLNPLRAIEVEDGELARREAEVSENLWRKELGPLDRAHFVAEEYELLRARSGLRAGVSAQEIAANARWKKEINRASADASAKIAAAYGFTDRIAEQFGYSSRTVRNDLLLARRLSPRVVEALRAFGHPITDNASQLRALAKLELEDQLVAGEHLVAGRAKNVAEAVALLRNRPKPSAEDRRLSSFIGTFARMSLAEKKGALAQLAGMLPAGWSLAEGGAK